MSQDNSTLTRNAALCAAALLTSSATLICCVLPAVLVALGAGAALAGLVSTIPQLVWLSEHKPLVFGIAGAVLAVSGASLCYSSSLPCPTNPDAARSCQQLRRLSAVLYNTAVGSFALGAAFAFLLPWFNT